MRRWIEAATLTALALAGSALADEPRQNYFNDPFLQITHGLPNCPMPPGPEITEAQMRAEVHSRVERGNSCYQSGRCRLANAYLYDAEIMPRVQRAIETDGRFTAGSSVWALGQRRWIWLKGCVSRPEDAQALERLVGEIDDVQGVVNQLTVLSP